MLLARLYCVLLCASCVRSSAVVCGDGESVCPNGTVCAPIAGTSDFACIGSTQACGNGILEPFRLVDGMAVLGEICDDGNQMPHDGCSPRCTAEQPRWRQRKLGPLTARTLPAAAFDVGNEQFVVFGGSNTNETWLGTLVPCGVGQTCLGWEQVFPLTAPLPRFGTAMAYDGARARVVLFGGLGLDDTWEWDGSTWTEAVVPSSARPPARFRHTLAYDSGRRRLILHGGIGAGDLGDTWEWDGERWSQVSPGPADPPPQADHAMAYDPVRGVIVMFGVADPPVPPAFAPPTIPVTYEFDGTWSLRTPAMSPPARTNAVLSFDPATHQILLVGGTANGTPLDDAWTWNGTDWQSQPSSPRASSFEAAAADPIHGRTIVVGGSSIANQLVWDGQWASTVALVPAHSEPAATYDPVRGTIIVMSSETTNFITQTFELDRSTWIARGAGTATAGAAMTFDTTRRMPFVFGGENNGLVDTLAAWDGATWSTRSPTGDAPQARADSAIAYDEKRDRLVLFGGRLDKTTAIGDMWEWSDTAQLWTPREIADPPPARFCHVLGYDPLHDQIVMFGGKNGTAPLDDTWVFDSSTDTWLMYEQENGPKARCDAAMTWSYARRRLVMFGGEGKGGQLQDTWEWRGTGWEPVLVEPSPPPRLGHTLTASARGVIAIGGLSSRLGGSTFSSEVWELVWDTDVAEDTCRRVRDSDADGRIGCDDPDCRAFCTPLCMPVEGTLVCAPGAPLCGDGIPDPLETCITCPQDVPECPIVCGDFICAPGEDCPGDCP